jgi:hypothetical protein
MDRQTIFNAKQYTPSSLKSGHNKENQSPPLAGPILTQGHLFEQTW